MTTRSVSIVRHTIISISVMLLPLAVSAQGMMGSTLPVTDDHTAREEAEGKEVWQKLQDKQLTCTDLSDDQFATIGEYFMGQMLGGSHAAMNAMMTRMMGEQGEEQMHIVMGKRLSGCDPSAVYPNSGTGFMPMMNMMMGGGFNMMNWWGYGPGMHYGFWGGSPFMFLWWILIVVLVVLVIKGLRHRGMTMHQGRTTALDILNERYAKGEISKQEFEEKKKDIS